MKLRTSFYYLIIPLFFLIATCSSKEKMTLESVLDKVCTNRAGYFSIQYKVSCLKKLFSRGDTITYNASCYILRNPYDSITGAYVWFRVSDNTEEFHDVNRSLSIYHDDQKIISWPYNTSNILTLMNNRGIIDFAFLDTINYFKSNDSITAMLEEDTIDNYPCWKIIVNPKGPKDIYNVEVVTWYRKSDYALLSKTLKAKFQGKMQYDEWNFTDIKYNIIDTTRINHRIDSLLSIYTISEETEEEEETLKPGDIAPRFSIQGFLSGQTFSMDSLISRLTLLDFWYMGCYPCVLSIPDLNNLYKEFQEDGLIVIGINPFDKKKGEKLKEDYAKFLEFNAIDYPVYFTTDHKADSLYKVSGYPTLFLIDDKGEIVFSQAGYYHGLADTLSSIIKVELGLN